MPRFFALLATSETAEKVPLQKAYDFISQYFDLLVEYLILLVEFIGIVIDNFRRHRFVPKAKTRAFAFGGRHCPFVGIQNGW